MPDRWEIIRGGDDTPLLADILMIHVALLPSGEVLGFAGSQHSEDPQKPYRCVLWDPADPHHMTVLPAPELDLFCAGHCLLPDGNVLIAGGTANYDKEPGNSHRPYHFTGIPDCFLFDWRSRTWSRVAPMAYGRWYPTLLPLADGRVLTVSGHGGPELPSHEVLETEIYDPAANRWEPARPPDPRLEDTGKFWLFVTLRPMVYYWRMHGLADRRVFSSTALQQVGGKRRTRVLDVPTNILTTVGPAPRGMLVPLMSHVYSRSNFTSVLLPLLPPDYAQHVLIAGGRRAYRFEVGGPRREWRRAGRRRPYKMRAYTTGLLLPDGSVVCVGGGKSEKVPRWYWPWSEVGGYDRDSNPVPERYLPDSDTWVAGAAPADYPPIPRMYHTSAIVLPSGQVLVCGSNRDSQRSRGGGAGHEHHGQDTRELRLELYSPPYLFDSAGNPAPRIEVTLSRTEAGYGEQLTLRSPDAERIRRVTVLRCASVTHGYSSDQRLVELSIGARTHTEVTVTTPPTPEIGIPGYYLLFALDRDGVPAHGRYLRLG
ncbi:galactose oxidase early set domain-containing protein [Actinoplanes sp. NPDC051346]|uniref:galactose oxidase early set domain-containing protein n=1 Tax=Actinoplanes sp. NPDC051346 TaxID=3155048 RepID=UPI00341E64F2